MIRGTDTRFAQTLADGMGILGSAVCVLHCLALPTMLVLGTAVPAALLSDDMFHSAMLWIIIPSAVLAFGIGCRRHKDATVLVLGVIGIVAISAAAVLLHDLVGEFGERLVTLIAVAMLTLAHYRNFRLCRAQHCDHG